MIDREFNSRKHIAFILILGEIFSDLGTSRVWRTQPLTLATRYTRLQFMKHRIGTVPCEGEGYGPPNPLSPPVFDNNSNWGDS